MMLREVIVRVPSALRKQHGRRSRRCIGGSVAFVSRDGASADSHSCAAQNVPVGVDIPTLE